RCSISRAVGDLLVEVTEFRLTGETPQLDLYLASDFPLTQQVLEQAEPRIVSLAVADADPAESDLLRRLGFDDLLMLPIRSRGRGWGLVEVTPTNALSPRPMSNSDRPCSPGAEARLGALEHG
ncbi:MAG TPA: GAF domain-containing protein, partial [Gaiellaceae bacterium]|nr:GAF domain-containing protein [Gaiellaceae bacterium]